MNDRPHPAPGSGVWQITGVLHAAAVRDGHLPLVIHPDDGGVAVPMSYGSDQLTTLRLCLCRRITVEGAEQTSPAGAPVFRLTAVKPMPER